MMTDGHLAASFAKRDPSPKIHFVLDSIDSMCGLNVRHSSTMVPRSRKSLFLMI